MKRFLTVVLTIICLFTISSIAVFATSDTYDLDELGLQVTIPSGYSVITRDTPASDPIFNNLGTTRTAIMSMLEASGIYLSAISNTYNEEVVVTMMENNLSNFSLLSDTELEFLASTLVNEYTNYGVNVSKCTIYQHSQAKFVVLYFTDTEKTVHGLQYYTIYDGKAMNFTMRSYEGSLSSRQETTIKSIVDSIEYYNAPPILEEGEDTASFVYTDTDTGVTFTVPENWKQEEFVKDREFIDVKFVSTKESGCTMIYGSTDAWSMMTESERAGSTRSDLNNSAFAKSDIAEMYGITADKVSTVTYNGVQYFKIEVESTSDVYGFDINVTMTQLIYMDNGWMYSFQFGGTSSHNFYSDFESLLNTVQYHDSSNNTNVGDNDNSDGVLSAIAVVTFLIVVAIITIAVVVSQKRKTSPMTPRDNTFTFETSSNTERTVFCRNCGRKLPSDSEFCHNCGTKIEKEDIPK